MKTNIRPELSVFTARLLHIQEFSNCEIIPLDNIGGTPHYGICIMANTKKTRIVISPSGRRIVLTPYQERFIATVRGLIQTHGINPTYREIAEAAGISEESAISMVRKLVARGYLTQIKGQWRTIRPTFTSLAA